MNRIFISIFVVLWLLLFYYESTRHFYLEPLLKRPLPKTKFLFPPAGWIMFYNVGEGYGYAEVHGVKDGQTQELDPHQILQTRAIGYDNINRNALVSVLSQGVQTPFCAYLRRKFPYFERFVIVYANYPSVVQQPFAKTQTVAYECR